MKYLILAALMALSTPALAYIDYTCLNDCTDRGSMYGYCQEKCSYGGDIFDTYNSNNPIIKSIDYTCVNECTSLGYMYSYCQEACSY